MKTFPLHEAVLRGDVALVETLLHAGLLPDALDDHGHTPLHWAVFRGCEDTARALLQAGANPNAFAGDGVTPAWRAVDFGLHEIRQLLAGYGGRVDTNEQFNRSASQAFNELIQSPLPCEEKYKNRLLLATWMRQLLKWSRL